MADPHAMWQEEIKRRNTELIGETEEELKGNADWWPFVQNIEDIIERCYHLEQRIDDLHNVVGETKGMILNLRKILIKLEIIDDRFIIK